MRERQTDRVREQENERAKEQVLLGWSFEKVPVSMAGADLAAATELQSAGWGSAS